MHSPARFSPCISHATTAQVKIPPLWGWQGELAGSQGWRGGWPRSTAAGEAQLSFHQALSVGVMASITLPCCPSRPQAHLILLGELQPIVGLEPFDVVSEFGHGDGGVVTHACKRNKEGGRERRTVTALHGQGRLSKSMCTANPGGGCEEDTCDDVKRRVGWTGS